MSILFTVVIVAQVISALVIIGLVLLQHGKGADMGAAFGSGASGSLFGATGSSNFLSKSTAVAAVIFFGATLALAFFGNQRAPSDGGVMENLPAVQAPAAAPAAAESAQPAQAPAEGAAPAGAGNASGQADQIPK